MAMELTVQIVTPYGEVFQGEVQSCTLPGTEGGFQVLPLHADLVSLLDIGSIKIQINDQTTRFLATSGGYCEVKDNVLKIIVESAEFAEKIDLKRAEAARKRAEQRLKSTQDDIDIPRARLALARALNRIRVAQFVNSLN